MNPLKKIKTLEELRALSPILIKLSAKHCRTKKIVGIYFDDTFVNSRYFFKLKVVEPVINDGWWVCLFYRDGNKFYLNDTIFFKYKLIL